MVTWATAFTDANYTAVVPAAGTEVRVEGQGAIGDAEAMFHPGELRERPLEGSHILALDEGGFVDDPREACRGAHLVTTDVWTSMGYEAENAARIQAFANWCVDEAMMQAADKIVAASGPVEHVVFAAAIGSGHFGGME